MILYTHIRYILRLMWMTDGDTEALISLSEKERGVVQEVMKIYTLAGDPRERKV